MFLPTRLAKDSLYVILLLRNQPVHLPYNSKLLVSSTSQAKWPCFTQPSPIWNHTLRTSRVGFMSSNLNLIASLRKERQNSIFYPKKTTLRLQQCGHTHLAFQCNQHLRQGFFWNLPKSFENIPSDGAMFFSPVATPETKGIARPVTGWLVRLQAALQHHLWKLSWGGGGFNARKYNYINFI